MRNKFSFVLTSLCLTFILIATLPTTVFAAADELNRTGGPDGYGYRYIDNVVEPTGPTFDWFEIAGDAGGPGFNTGLTLNDQNVAVPLSGFFPFYGTTYTDSINICTNGFVGFGLTSSYFNNVALPFTNHVQPGIYPFWDDLDPTQGGSIWYYRDSTNHRFIVEWYQVPHYYLPLYTYTFQLRLYESGVIECMYRDMSALNNHCTIGLQGPNSGANNRYLQYCYNSSTITPTNSMAIRFYLSTGTISATIRGAGSVPIRNALVEVTAFPNLFRVTDSLGVAVFPNILVASNYRLRAIAPTYRGTTSSGTFSVTANATVSPGLTLTTATLVVNPPVNLTATTGLHNRVPLIWSRPTGTGIFGYSIWRITGTDTLPIGVRSTATDTTFSDTTVTDGIEYRYFVKTHSTVGMSDLSNVVSSIPRPDPGYSYDLGQFNWIDIRNRSIGLICGDDELTPAIALPFRFPLYSSTWDSVECSTNGFIGNHLAPSDRLLRAPTPIEHSSIAQIVAGSWMDLVVANDSIRYAFDTLNNRFVISYFNAHQYQNPNLSITMQYVLYPNGVIDINYLHAEEPLTLYFGICTQSGANIGESSGHDSLNVRIRRTSRLYGSIAGVLRDSTNNNAIAGRIDLYDGSYPRSVDVQLPNSEFQFLNVNALPVSVIASAFGYHSRTIEFQLRSNLDTNLTILLRPISNQPPAGFMGDGFHDDRIIMNWQAPGSTEDEIASLSGYRIYRNDTLLANLAPNIYEYIDSSRGSRGEGIYSWYNVAAVYTAPAFIALCPDSALATYNMPPAKPAYLTASIVDTTLLLRWSPVTTNADSTPCVDLTGYKIYRDTTLIGTVAANIDSFVYDPPSNNRGYTYRIEAFDDAIPANVSEKSDPFFISIQQPWSTVNYTWYNTTNWTDLGLRVDGSVRVPLGFSFPFFGVNYDSVYISSNGFLSFTSPQWYPRQCPGFPSSDLPNAVIAPLWGDLDCSSGSVKINTLNGLFIVSYTSILHAPSQASAGNFQVRLDQSGAIYFAYQYSPSFSDYGIGIEDQTGTQGFQLNLNGTGVFRPTSSSSIGFWSTQRSNGSLSGRIVRGNGLPLAGAQISVANQWTATSLANGYYSIALQPGNWVAKIVASCFVPDTIYHAFSITSSTTTSISDTVRHPSISTTPTSFDLQTPTNGVTTVPLTITNSGDAPLNWKVTTRNRTSLLRSGSSWRRERFDPSIDARAAILPSPLPAQTLAIEHQPKIPGQEETTQPVIQSVDQFWGPDSFGYYCYDLSEINFPEWLTFRNIASTGTLVLQGDDEAIMTQMDGFNFYYYGTQYNRIRVNTNGVAQFINSDDPLGSRVNLPLPTETAINAVMPLWDDLEASVYKFYDAVNNVFILEWVGNRIGHETDTVRFEAQFHANNRAIVFLYDRVPVSQMSATVGIQGSTGANRYYIQNYYGASAGQGLPTNMNGWGLAYFYPNYAPLRNWLTVSPDSGVVAPGSSVNNINVTITLDTTYHINDRIIGDIIFSTNDCSTRVVSVNANVIFNGTDPHRLLGLPEKIALHPNYPNPFNPLTEIRFDLPEASSVQLVVFDLNGREIARLVDGKLPAGYHSTRFNGSGLASGVYFYRLNCEGWSQTQRMVILK